MRVTHPVRINAATGLFVLLFLSSAFLRSQGPDWNTVARALALASLVPFVAAFWSYLETKGRPGILGLLALIPVLGVVFLVLLPKRQPTCSAQQAEGPPTFGEFSSRAA